MDNDNTKVSCLLDGFKGTAEDMAAMAARCNCEKCRMPDCTQDLVDNLEFENKTNEPMISVKDLQRIDLKEGEVLAMMIPEDQGEASSYIVEECRKIFPRNVVMVFPFDVEFRAISPEQAEEAKGYGDIDAGLDTPREKR